MNRSLCLVAAAALTGCATLIHGKHDTITLHAPDPATAWTVNGADAGIGATVRYDLPTLNNRGARIVARLGECEDSTTVDTRFDPVTLAGIFIDGGLVSIAVVDGLATGAVTRANTLDYRLDPECAQ